MNQTEIFTKLTDPSISPTEYRMGLDGLDRCLWRLAGLLEDNQK